MLNTKIKIAIAEDNDLLAASVKEKLEIFEDEVEHIFRGKNGIDFLEKLQKNRAVDVILMDIEMPRMDGISTTMKVTELYPQIKIIMLTVFDDQEKIFQSIQAGASGYLLKDETPDKIIDGIKMIMAGGAPMSPTIAAKALNLLRTPPSKEITEKNKSKNPEFTLTQRETDVLTQLSKGLDYNQASENLFISPSTVRKHIENIYKKLQVHNKIQAVQKAQKYNLI
ncbi:MAG: DNA-binding response regulator [Melioribacteraceae bacterium]|nr:MAG: DNA-binding response regulator [Melioribacteraceae bacterium]